MTQTASGIRIGASAYYNLPDILGFEASLAERLRRCRLVFEMLDESTVNGVRIAVDALASKVPTLADVLADRFPTLTTVFLVSEAIDAYRGVSYWPNLRIRTTPQQQYRLGNAFLDCLRHAGLETFDLLGEEGHRYLTPILAHAGIPRYCLGDFFEKLLLRELRRGTAPIATEMLAHWRVRRTAFQGVDRPVERFLLYGGATAVDLVDRCIDLIFAANQDGSRLDARDFGLPPHVVDEFRRIRERAPSEWRGPSAKRTGTSVPSPRVKLDPWTRHGPFVEVPPIGSDHLNATWSIEDGRGYRSEDASMVQALLIGLFPAAAWTVEYQSGDRRRSTVFERLPETGVAAFDPSTTELARDPRYLPWDSAWLLAPQGVTLEGVREGQRVRLAERESLPPPIGAWAGYSLAEYDLRGISSVVVTHSGATGVRSETIRVVTQAAFRPELTGEIVRGVTTLAGWPVYADVPRITFPTDANASAWRVQITRDGAKATETTSQGVLETLSAMVGEAPASTYQVIARGPIGSDLRTEFAVVAGLTTRGTRVLRLPGDRPQLIHLTADAGVLLDGHSGSGQVTLGPDQDVAEFRVRSAGESLQLRVACNRVKWGLITGAAATNVLAVGRLTIYLDDLASEAGAEWGSSLLVATGIPATDVALSLIHRGHELCRITGRTSRHDGRVALDLGGLRDAALAEGASAYELGFAISDRAATVAMLHVRLKVVSFSCRHVPGSGGDVLKVSALGLQHFRNREVLLWSVYRVAEPVVRVSIPDQAGEQFDVPVPPLTLGRYRAELGVRDEWAAPTRPSHQAPNTAYFHVGSPRDYTDDLRRRSSSGTAAACEALLAGSLERALTLDELIEMAPHLTTAAVEWLPEANSDGPVLRELIPLFRKHAQYLLPGVSEAVALSVAGTVTLSRVLRFALLVLPLVEDPDAAPLWMEARRVWATFPYLAAQVDIPRAWMGDEDASSRCAEFLGCQPGSLPLGGPPPQMSTSPPQNLLALPVEALRHLQLAMDLVPGALLTPDEYASAGLEWLASGRVERQCERWWERHRSFQDYAAGTTPEVRAYLAARTARPGVSAWAGFPELTLAAAMCLLSTPGNGNARAALLEAVAFAPCLIAFDLALARVLLARQAVAVADA